MIIGSIQKFSEQEQGKKTPEITAFMTEILGFLLNVFDIINLAIFHRCFQQQ